MVCIAKRVSMQQHVTGPNSSPLVCANSNMLLAGYYLPICSACWGGRVLGLDALPGLSPACCRNVTCALPEGRLQD